VIANTVISRLKTVIPILRLVQIHVKALP